MRYLNIVLATIFLTGSIATAALDINATGALLKRYDVSWKGLGKSAADSMPVGNGDIGLNVWTESNGDICFYIGKTDAWSEENKGPWGLLKLGRIRLTLTPNPFADSDAVTQTLQLENGSILLTAGAAHVRIWVDANNPAIHVIVDDQTPVSVKAAYESLRPRRRGIYSADLTIPDKSNRVVWYHHNTTTADPHLMNWTFGAAMQGSGFVRDGQDALRSARRAAHQQLSIYPLTAHPASPEQWLAQLQQSIARVEAVDIDAAWNRHVQWWHNFWNRSWIFASGDDDAISTTRGYVLQRFVTACAGRGAYPIKFNGSIFVVDDPKLDKGLDRKTGKHTYVNASADYRRWGGQYWFQNTRAMYWPRLMAGDFDMMLPLFHMYQQILKSNTALVKQFYGHGGSYLAETAPFYGGIHKLNPTQGKYTDHYFTPILELSTMMLDYYAYTQDTQFLKQTALPMADAGLTFFDHHFPRDDHGKLLLDHDNSIETYWVVHDPAPDIDGLHYVTQRLLALPTNLTTDAERTDWRKLQAILPPLPEGMKNGKEVLLPYTGPQTVRRSNSENPELYEIYPFRIFELGKPNL